MESKGKTYNTFEDDVLRQIKGYDVIYLVETHLSESVPLPSDKYNIFYFIRLLDANAKINTGGISIMIKDAISKVVMVLKSRHSNYKCVNVTELTIICIKTCAYVLRIYRLY